MQRLGSSALVVCAGLPALTNLACSSDENAAGSAKADPVKDAAVAAQV